MKRRILTVTVTAALMVTGTSVAWADPGDPGSTFPEQPGANPTMACVAVGTNPGSGMGGAAQLNIAPTGGAIVTNLYTDVCG